MSKCCTIKLPAMGKCCETLHDGGEHEFTIKVKMQCGEGEDGCRIELSHEGCCDEPAAGGSGKK
jgi:hypothetical protein